ncbi:MAG: DUF4332 domain-containing protein, partial [Promethearchaeota archaeon]
MDKEEYTKFLKRMGKKPHVIEQFLEMLEDYEAFLMEHREVKTIEASTTEDLEAYVEWYERTTSKKANRILWGLLDLFEFLSREDLLKLGRDLREARTKKTRAVFKLKDYVGINQSYVKQLADIGIKDIQQMLEAGKTKKLREELAEKTGIPKEEILKFVKLANLSRLGAVKKIRAPL